MAITVSIPAGLRDWISDNLRRGQPPAQVIQQLMTRNIEASVARGLVETLARASNAASTSPEHCVKPELHASDYWYEMPRIASGNAICAAGHEIRVLLRHERPVVVTLECVLTAAECARLIELARPRLRPSTIVDPRTGAHAVADRGSEGMFFLLRENPFIARLDERISALMNCPVENGEGLQVLRYAVGGEYPPHFDFLIPRNTASRESIARSGQRCSTLIGYLNDVQEGGETTFPELGLAVIPRRGNAVYFEYANSHLQVDRRSLHAGRPVVRGEKWIVTKWMRTRRFVSAGVAN